MNQTSKFVRRLWLVLLGFALFLVACGPRYETGLDAVTQTGRWMSVLQPVQDAPPQLTVVDMYTGKPQLTLADANIYQQPITVFSPSGDYLLYRGSEMWYLVEMSSQGKWEVASTSMNVEFLPDDEILITNQQQVSSTDGSQSQRLYQIWLTSPRSPGQTSWDLITEKGRYIFRSQAQGLSGVSGSSAVQNTPAQAFCSPTVVLARDTRVVVDTDGTVFVLISDTQGSDVRRLHRLSAATTDLLHTHEALQEALALQQIRETPGYENMSEAEKAALVDTIAHSGITGLVSPDGQRLLILTATSIGADINKYSLNLINLETDRRIVLSTESDWTPAFLFSPDGSQVIYESNIQGDRAWYLGPSDGVNTMRLALQGVEALCWH